MGEGIPAGVRPETEPQGVAETATGAFTRMAPWMLGSRAFVMVMAVAGTAVLTRTLSKDDWNEYSLLKNMWTYIWLLGQLGLNEATLRFGAELAAHGDTAGFKRLLKKAILLQASALAVMFVVLVITGDWLGGIFRMSFGIGLIMTVLLSGITTFKETLRQGYVAAYWIKMVALMSVIGAVTFPVASYVFIKFFGWGVSGGLAGEATGYAVMMLVFVAGLPRLRFKKTVSDAAAREPVTNFRIFRYSGAIIANNALTLAFGPQMVIFLVGYFLEGAVGIYSLASLLPMQGMMFIIQALFPLVMAVITKTYCQDRERLPDLLRSYYKLMMIFIVPSVTLGLLFLDKGLAILAGARGVEAGALARMLLPVQLNMILVLPISAGMNVLEKAHRFITTRIIAGACSITTTAVFLLFWPDLHALVAVIYLELFLIVPVTMSIAVRLVGGFYFPYRFCGKAVACCAAGLLVFYPVRALWPVVEGWSAANLGHHIPGSAALLVAASVLFLGFVAVAARVVGLFGPDELKYFRNARLPGIDLLMRLFVKSRYR